MAELAATLRESQTLIQSMLHEAQLDRQDVKESISVAEAAAQNKARSLDAQACEIETLRAEKISLVQATLDLKADKASLEEANAVATDQVADRTRKIQHMSDEKDQLGAELKSIKSDLASKEDIIGAVKSESRAAQERADGLVTALAEVKELLVNTLQSRDEERKTHATALADKVSTLTSLKHQHANCQASLTEAQTRLTDVQKEVTAVSDALTKSEREKKVALEKLHQLEADHKKLEGKHKTLLSAKTTTMSLLATAPTLVQVCASSGFEGGAT